MLWPFGPTDPGNMNVKGLVKGYMNNLYMYSALSLSSTTVEVEKKIS